MPSVFSQGQSIFFEDSGSGPPLVLLHSFLCSGKMWCKQVPVLAQQYRVINIDLRGHGRSGAVSRPFSLYDLVMDVVAVLDSLDIHRAVWCGLSIGGMVAMRAALACPDRVAVLAQLSQVQVPALVLVGAEDSSLPPPLSRRIHEQLADSRLVQLPAAGHLSVLEQADAVNAALLDFLPRCGATSGW